jgi:hypothetical protein
VTALTLDLDTLTLAKGGHGSQTPPDCGNPVVCFWEARNVQLGRGWLQRPR